MTTNIQKIKSEDAASYAATSVEFELAPERFNTETTSCREERILKAALAILASRVRSSPVFSSPDTAKDYLRVKLTALEHEVFGAFWLTTQNQLITDETLATGTIDSAAVYPREVIKSALKHAAQAVVFYHNHPSGIAAPSAADRAITDKLKQALGLLDIRVLDHLIITDGDVYSFAEHGLL